MSETPIATRTPKALRKLEHKYRESILVADIFAACIETETLPVHGSPCHRMVRKLVKNSGIQPRRKRRRLPKIKHG